MEEHEKAVDALDDAAFALLKLSSAYNGRLGEMLYNLAADVSDRVRRARREIASAEVPHNPLRRFGGEYTTAGNSEGI